MMRSGVLHFSMDGKVFASTCIALDLEPDSMRLANVHLRRMFTALSLPGERTSIEFEPDHMSKI